MVSLDQELLTVPNLPILPVINFVVFTPSMIDKQDGVRLLKSPNPEVSTNTSLAIYDILNNSQYIIPPAMYSL